MLDCKNAWLLIAEVMFLLSHNEDQETNPMNTDAHKLTDKTYRGIVCRITLSQDYKQSIRRLDSNVTYCLLHVWFLDMFVVRSMGSFLQYIIVWGFRSTVNPLGVCGLHHTLTGSFQLSFSFNKWLTVAYTINHWAAACSVLAQLHTIR